MRVEFLAADTGHKTEAWLRQEQRQESSEDHGGLGSRPLLFLPAASNADWMLCGGYSYPSASAIKGRPSLLLARFCVSRAQAAQVPPRWRFPPTNKPMRMRIAAITSWTTALRSLPPPSRSDSILFRHCLSFCSNRRFIAIDLSASWNNRIIELSLQTSVENK